MLQRRRFEIKDLVNTMLDALPAETWTSSTTTFLDPSIGGGQFVAAIEKRLADAGHSAENIKNRVFGYEANTLRIRTTVGRMKLKGTYRKSNFINEDNTMKFDVVVGNPPYQDAENDKRMLWNQFCDKAIDVTKDNGYIAFVTPKTWLHTNSNIHNSYKLLEDYQTQKAVVYGAGDTPFSVGSSISYHITQKIERTTTTPVYIGSASKGTETFAADIDLANDKLWPADMTEINISIHNKINTFDKIVWTKSCEFHNQKLKTKGLVSDERTEEFPYTHHVSPKITRYTNTKFSRHDDWKVMVAVTSTVDKAVVDKDCGHGEDMFTLYVGSELEANSIKSVLQSKLYKFIGKLYRYGRGLQIQGIFPTVDFTKTWTDEEMYNYFGLSQEEINYIEETV